MGLKWLRKIYDSFHPCLFIPIFCQHGANEVDEVDESFRKTHDQGRLGKCTCHRAWLETKGLLGCFEDYRRHCHERGEEDGHFHNAWLVPHQNPNETSHQGRSQKCFWQGGEGQSKASKDDREGLPGCCIEAADLESF